MLSINNTTRSRQQIISLSGALIGIDALNFRDKTSSIIEIEEGQVQIDVSRIDKMDLTGFNSLVMLKKEVNQRGLNLLIVSERDNPIHEFIHLSKLSFPCANSSSL